MKVPVKQNRANTIFVLSKREVILRRVFKIAVRNRHFVQEQFHDFCRWAKGKSESQLIREVS